MTPAMRGHTLTLEALVRLGADVNAADRKWLTAKDYAPGAALQVVDAVAGLLGITATDICQQPNDIGNVICISGIVFILWFGRKILIQKIKGSAEALPATA